MLVENKLKTSLLDHAELCGVWFWTCVCSVLGCLSQRGYNALLVAAECGNTYALHKLRAHNVDPRVVTDEGHDILLLASIGGHEALLADVLDWGKPPKVRQYEKPWTLNLSGAQEGPPPERMDVPSLKGQSLVVRRVLLLFC